MLVYSFLYGRWISGFEWLGLYCLGYHRHLLPPISNPDVDIHRLLSIVFLVAYLCFNGVRVTRSLVLCVMFCRSLFVLFSFVPCVVYLSSNYGFWSFIFGIIKLFFFQNKSANSCGELYCSPLEFNVLLQIITVNWTVY